MMCIPRALLTNPNFLLMNEPSSGPAPLLMKELFEVIKALREQGTTILLVEQNPQRALEIADRGYVLENGWMMLQGKGEELLENNHVKGAYLGL